MDTSNILETEQLALYGMIRWLRKKYMKWMILNSLIRTQEQRQQFIVDGCSSNKLLDFPGLAEL